MQVQMQPQLQPGQAPAPGDYATLRAIMVERQIRTFDVTDQRLIARFQLIPRELFAPDGQSALAYSDAEMRAPTAEGARAILAPLALARLLQAADISAGDTILDVAGARGYSAAIVAGLAQKVVALESDAALSSAASGLFDRLGLTNVKAVCGALESGAAGEGPYDVIIVNGAVEGRLDAGENRLTNLFAQLAPGGRLLAFEPQTAGAARAFLYERNGADISRRPLFGASARLLQAFASRPAFTF